MKLLLTSGGLPNASIVSALRELLGKDFSEANLLFVTTASNVEVGDKSWVIKDLVKCKELGFKEIEMTDIAVVSKDVWLPKFEHADVILVEGGNSSYLMSQIKKSGLIDLLPELLKTRVYVGISAGTVVMSQNLHNKAMQKIYKDPIIDESNVGLGYVDFFVLPHLNSTYFPRAAELVEEIANGMSETLYALDDESAIVVNNDTIEVVSEGVWKKYN